MLLSIFNILKIWKQERLQIKIKIPLSKEKPERKDCKENMVF